MYLRAADPAEVLKSMQGRWKTKYSEIDGQIGSTEDDHFLIYKDNTFTVEKGGKVAHEGRFAINTAQLPIQVAYIYSKSFPIYLGGPRAGIIQLEGDTLKCCFAALGQPAPKEFNTFPGSEAALTIHERVIQGGQAHRVTVSSASGVAEW